MTWQMDRIVETLALMAEAELAVARLYQAFAEREPGQREFWRSLADQEEYHAEMLRYMRGIIVGVKGADCAPGRSITPESTRNFAAYVGSVEDRARSGEILPREFKYLARDIEESLIESRFTEIVKTSNESFLTAAGKIMEETAAHRESLRGRIEKENSDPRPVPGGR